MKSIALSSSLIAAAALLATSAPFFCAEPAPTNASVLRVGVAPVSPPMIFKEAGQLVGAEVDFAQALGRELGRPIQFVELPFEDLIDALNDNKIDIIMSSMSITRARQFRVAFSDPYLRVGQMALVRAKEQFRYAPFGFSMAKKDLGVRKATTGDLLVQQEFPQAKRKYFKSGLDGAKALSKGRIDLYIDDSTMIWYLAGLYESEGLVVSPMVLSDEVLGWGVRRSDPHLLESVNAFLKKFMSSGQLTQTLKRWIPKFQ